jgi:hypothetical protein
MDEITLTSSLNIVANIRNDLATNGAIDRATTLINPTTLVQANRLAE